MIIIILSICNEIRLDTQMLDTIREYNCYTISSNKGTRWYPIKNKLWFIKVSTISDNGDFECYWLK